MRLFRPVPLVCLALLLPVSVSAQSTATTATTPPASDPQAVALLQKSLTALTNGAPITDVTLTGSARRIAGSDDETGSATLQATAVGDSRVELSFASGNRIEIRNHSALPLAGSLPRNVPASAVQAPQATGEWIGTDGVGHGTAPHNLMTDAAWFFPALMIEHLVAAQNYALSYIGQETHNGTAVLRISAVEQFPKLVANSPANLPGPPPAQIMQHLSQMDLYFDPSSSLPIAIDFNQHPDNNALIDIPTEIRFSDYKSFGRVAVPTGVQKYVNNSLVLDLQFTSVTLNSGLSTSAFALQ